MATRDCCDDGATLPGVVPFDPSPLSRLSWELGSRIVDDDESIRLGRWEHVESSRSLTFFQVTGETVVIRIETPIGRERFYGAALMDLSDVRPALDDTPSWSRA